MTSEIPDIFLQKSPDTYSLHSIISESAHANMLSDPATFSRLVSSLPTLSLKDIDVFKVGADAKIVSKDGKPVKLKASELQPFEYALSDAKKKILDYLSAAKEDRERFSKDLTVLFILNRTDTSPVDGPPLETSDVEYQDFVTGYSETMMVFTKHGGRTTMEDLNNQLTFLYSNLQGKLCIASIRWGGVIANFSAANTVMANFMKTHAEVLPIPDYLRQCNFCGKAAMHMEHCICSKIPLPPRYKSVQYCSKQCQKTHWPNHKVTHEHRLLESSSWNVEKHTEAVATGVAALQVTPVASDSAAAAVSSASEGARAVNECVMCGESASLQCVCGTRYCSKKCQLDGWKQHKKFCKPKGA